MTVQIHPDDRAVIDQFEVGTAAHALEICAWGMMQLGYGVVDAEPGEWMQFIAPNNLKITVRIEEDDPGNHPDADRPPGTSGSWGEA